jgi:predicted homoserine dehydrogenase-like protein
MILIDNTLRKRQQERNPIKVGIIGTGVMGRGIMNQINRYSPGIVIAAVYNRTLEKARSALSMAGISDIHIAESRKSYHQGLEMNKVIVTQDVDLLCEAPDLDLLIEITGTIEFATRTMIKAFDHGKNVLSFNAEIEATLGPILKYRAKKAGVKYSVADGDQPAVTMNLYRQVVSMGLQPLLCGNIKGLQDRSRNPTTQKSFAAQWAMTPEMVTSFADGTKISFEQACLANATGMTVAKRGMLGYHSQEHVDNLVSLYDVEKLKELGGIVDYVVGPKPGPGVFIYASTEDAFLQKYLQYMKLGKGPLYSFYVPYHLLFLEIANSISRMIDFDDDILSAKDGICVEVVATAKIDLKVGDKLDGIGAYKTYGLCEKHSVSSSEGFLPMGLAEGCRLHNSIKKDQVIRLEDVIFPQDRMCDALWQEQNLKFNDKN